MTSAARVGWRVWIALVLGLAAVPGSLHANDPSDIEAGRVLYLRFCASCHGPNADGRGPVAPVLETRPANLRMLTTRYGSPLPEAQIAAFIDGRAAVAAHGDRDMPVWGDRFNDIPAEGAERERAVKDRIARIVAYLESIQIQPAQ